MHTPENATEENRRLRRTMRDVIALSTLPAVWTGLDPDGIARSLADVLLNTLALDLIYVRLEGLPGQGMVEVVRGKNRPDAGHDARVKAALAALMSPDRTEPPSTMPDPFGAGTLHVAVTRFGIGGDRGVLVAASSDADFPTERDRLLLGVGANQTAIVVQRKQAVEQIREQAERLRTTLASIGDAVITTDNEGRVTNLNPVAESLTGWTNAEAAGQPLATVFRIVNAETRQAVEDPMRRALREDVIVGLANHPILIAKDGTERPIDDRAAPIRCREGKLVGCVLVFRDVTERQRLEKQRVEQGEAARRLAAIVDSSEDAIISKTLDSIIQTWNAAAERIFGYTAEEAVGRSITLLFPADRLDEEDKIIARIRAGERVEHFDTLRKRKDGTLIDVSLTISPVRDDEGRIEGASKIARDITPRKRSEKLLRESEERLAADLEVMTRLHALSTRLLASTDLRAAMEDVLQEAILVSRADLGNIQLYNPQSRALEIVAQRGFRQDFLDYFRFVRMDEGSACARAMQSGERIILEDVQLDPSYEQHRAIAAAAGYRAVQSTPLRDSSRAIIGMMSTHFRQPHRLSERDERLLDLHARHAADLIQRFRYEQALKEEDRRKDEFLATLAHELRNPLAPIRNALQIIRLSNERETREQARDLMERQLGQLVRLVDDLMDVSRISWGKIELRKERAELAAVVTSAVETSRPLIDEMGHDLTVQLPKLPVVVEGDVTRLAQVFLNLLNNAAKYSERGGRIRLTVEQQGSDVVVSVRDTGIGIAAEQLPRIFEMFAQVDHSLEKAQGGLGIGLTLVKRLVEMHGGEIEARSDGPGRGSEFRVRLPIVVSASRPRAAGGEEPSAPQALLRILIVDDNRDGANSLAMMLEIMGNDVRTAYDGEQGVDVAREFRPDVVLLDIGLPKLNGYEACRRIREQPWGRQVVMVACTGWGQEDDKRKSREAGFDHHLVKPVGPPALMKILAGLHVAKG